MEISNEISEIYIDNFRAAGKVELRNLDGSVIIAGANGCGKSSIFDAIRLLKSSYAQSSRNEWRRWFDEFQVNINKLPQEAHRGLSDPKRRTVIRIELVFESEELDYIRNNGPSHINRLNWSRISNYSTEDDEYVADPSTIRANGDRIKQVNSEMCDALMAHLDTGKYVAEVNMSPKGEVLIESSPVIEMAFNLPILGKVSIIDYYGANRTFSREQLGGINLNIRDASEARKQHLLFDTQNKYSSIKTEMAQSYIRQILLEKRGGVRMMTRAI